MSAGQMANHDQCNLKLPATQSVVIVGTKVQEEQQEGLEQRLAPPKKAC
jgi:hypothetical protein